MKEEREEDKNMFNGGFILWKPLTQKTENG